MSVDKLPSFLSIRFIYLHITYIALSFSLYCLSPLQVNLSFCFNQSFCIVSFLLLSLILGSYLLFFLSFYPHLSLLLTYLYFQPMSTTNLCLLLTYVYFQPISTSDLSLLPTYLYFQPISPTNLFLCYVFLLFSISSHPFIHLSLNRITPPQHKTIH